MSQLKKIKIKEHAGYYFSYDPEDPSVPVIVNSNWRKTGKTPAVIDETYSKPLKTADERPRVYVYIATMNKKVRVYLDDLVASYLIPNPNNYEMIIHKDGNKYNCHPSNLEWATKDQFNQYAISINDPKGKTKQFLATYKDGTTEIVTGFLDFIKKKNIPEQALYKLRKGQINEYKGLISFEEIEKEPEYRDKKKSPVDFNFDGLDIIELDDWPGYYVVYKKDDVNVPVKIFSKWKKDKDEMVLCEDFVRETSQHTHKTGYVQVNMKLPGEKKIVKKLHRLIAIQLIENSNPMEYHTVDHIDCNKLNNHPSNLQWLSNSLNVKKAFEDGIHERITFEITFKDGRTEIISNLSKFCRENNYNVAGCYNVINNKQPAHKDIIKIAKIKT
jgi:predicted transcriptional regulator